MLGTVGWPEAIGRIPEQMAGGNGQNNRRRWPDAISRLRTTVKQKFVGLFRN